MEENTTEILLVEDDESHAEILNRAFESHAMKSVLTMARNLKEARSYLKKSIPDVMIADYLLPDGKGLELLYSIPENKDYPVIVMTSFGDEHVAVEAIKAGAIDYVVKSESTLLDMPHIIERALREWFHIRDKEKAEEEKLKLEKQLIRAQKLEAIGTLAGGIAHDFNNILGAIIGYTEMALFEMRKESIEAYNLEQVLRASHRAKDLVRQILAFSRKDDRDKKLVKLDHIVKEAIKLLRASLPVSIEINLEVGEDLGLIQADPSQIHQVVMNLCTNAWHAMEEEGGELKLYLAKVQLTGENLTQYPDAGLGSYTKLTISDTGHGMSKEVMERIFDPYFTTKDQSKGTGLGLAVVHGIVRGHDGHIRVRSDPGKGTTFEILFPLSEGEDNAERKGTPKLPHGKERILFVDDEELLVELGKQMLNHLGYTVRSTMNPNEAIEIFREAPSEYDLVITDMSMPGMSGKSLAESLKKIRPDIPVAICTGFSNQVNQENFREMGIQALLMKPLTIENLSETIRKVLDEACPQAE
jgi:signal transduction histidine kinase